MTPLQAFLVCGSSIHMAFLYILYSKKLDRYYIGSTNDPRRRIDEHQRGQTKSTQRGTPWELKLLQSFPSINQATRAEKILKRWKNRSIIERIILDQHFHSPMSLRSSGQAAG